MDAQQERAVNGAANAPLTHKQKADICIMASAAWAKQGRPYYDDDADPVYALCKADALELWRHEEQDRVIGRKHLTAAGQADFPLLMSHFARLAGKAARADHWAERRPGDDQRRAMRVLDNEVHEAKRWISNPRGYIFAILRSRYKVPIEHLTAKQIWGLVFDLRRNVAARKKKAAAPKTGELF